MSDEPRVYGIICEHKLEGPLIWESKPMTRDEAEDAMRKAAGMPNIIRAAIFSVAYVGGNKRIIEWGGE